MKHLGDITKIRGSDVPPVNVIIGGSPCQDLSVAGKRAGLAGERSGLFMEQLRIIKEMREADAGRGRSGKELRPRFMVWENVPGAFSSNKGADFGAVLQETIRVVCEAPAVPMPNKGWPLAGCLYGEGGDWSLAWRVFDAQFWGVPQRRRRIALVADFGGLTAPEILFERESVSGYYPQGRTPWETATAHPPSGTRDTSTSPPLMCAGFKSRAGAEADIAFRIEQSPTLLAGNDDASVILAPPLSVSENQQAEFRLSERCNALSTGGGQTRTGIPLLASVYDARGNGDGEVVPTMTGDHNGHVSDYTAVCVAQLAYDQFSESGIASTLKSSGGSYGGGSENLTISYQKVTGPLMANSHPGGYTGQDAFSDMLIASVDCRNGSEDSEINGTLQAKSNGGMSVNLNNTVRQGFVVRRLTPLECERLQGFLDGWTNIGDWIDSKGKLHREKDSPRYKALGNSIAIPSWFYVLQKLSLCCGADCTMASLFDGIGGFPYIWETLNGKGSCLWASEIEEFPIAVTKFRFPEETI